VCAVLAPRMLSFAPPSPPPLQLDASGDTHQPAVQRVEGRNGRDVRGRGRGRGRGGLAMAPYTAPSPPPVQIDLSTSPLTAPVISNSPGIAGSSPFRVRIGERAITDGLCALLQGMLHPQISQPPLTASSLLLLLQKMSPPALTLGRSTVPSWLQENTQQVVLVTRSSRNFTMFTGACRTATSSCDIC
jgi:hypothetical protein